MQKNIYFTKQDNKQEIELGFLLEYEQIRKFRREEIELADK